MSDDNIISFEKARDRREIAESEADQAQWENLRDRLIGTLMGSDFQNTALTSASINALLDVLQRSGMNFDDAKTLLARCVNVMH